MAEATRWVGSWTAAPAPAEGVALANQTLRMHPRLSLGGPSLRVRFSNAHGTRPLPIGAARVALRASGAGIAPAPIGCCASAAPTARRSRRARC